MLVRHVSRSGAIVVAAFLALAACKTVTTSTVADIGDGASGSAAADPDAAALHKNVLAALSANHAEQNGSMWFDGVGSLDDGWLLPTPDATWGQAANTIQGGVTCTGQANCEPTLQLQLCATSSECGSAGGICRVMQSTVNKPGGQAASVCVGNGDFFYERIYQRMITAKQSVDIVSLSAPTGRFRAALINAFAYLSQVPNPPQVRMLLGGFVDNRPNALNPPQDVLNTYVNDIRVLNPAFNMKLSYGYLANGLASWNHSKIVVVDGTTAIVGGENLWNDDYLVAQPVHDLSLEVHGAAAEFALKYADTLWRNDNISHAIYPMDADDSLGSLANTVTGVTSGTTPILGVGRLGDMGDNSADDALIAMVTSAQHSVKIVQQDLFNKILNPLNPAPTFLLQAIATAVLGGVDVTIIKSNLKGNGGGYGMLSPQDTQTKIVAFINKYAKKIGLPADPVKLCQHLHVAPFRFSADATWPDGMPIGAHTKLVVVDDAAFYLGSQNLYPAGLQEFGYIVFASDKTAFLETNYWTPLWQQSAPAVVTCTGVSGPND